MIIGLCKLLSGTPLLVDQCKSNHYEYKHPIHMQSCVPLYVQWVKAYTDLNVTCCLAFTLVITDFLDDKTCRPQKLLLINAVYLNINDYF